MRFTPHVEIPDWPYIGLHPDGHEWDNGQWTVCHTLRGIEQRLRKLIEDDHPADGERLSWEDWHCCAWLMHKSVEQWFQRLDPHAKGVFYQSIQHLSLSLFLNHVQGCFVTLSYLVCSPCYSHLSCPREWCELTDWFSPPISLSSGHGHLTQYRTGWYGTLAFAFCHCVLSGLHSAAH